MVPTPPVVPEWARDLVQVQEGSQSVGGQVLRVLVLRLAPTDRLRQSVWKQEAVLWLRRKLPTVEQSLGRGVTREELLALAGIICTLANGHQDFTWRMTRNRGESQEEQSFWGFLDQIQGAIDEASFSEVSKGDKSRMRTRVSSIATAPEETISEDRIRGSDSFARLYRASLPSGISRHHRQSRSGSRVRSSSSRRSRPRNRRGIQLGFCRGDQRCLCRREDWSVPCPDAYIHLVELEPTTPVSRVVIQELGNAAKRIRHRLGLEEDESGHQE